MENRFLEQFYYNMFCFVYLFDKYMDSISYKEITRTHITQKGSSQVNKFVQRFENIVHSGVNEKERLLDVNNEASSEWTIKFVQKCL